MSKHILSSFANHAGYFHGVQILTWPLPAFWNIATFVSTKNVYLEHPKTLMQFSWKLEERSPDHSPAFSHDWASPKQMHDGPQNTAALVYIYIVVDWWYYGAGKSPPLIRVPLRTFWREKRAAKKAFTYLGRIELDKNWPKNGRENHPKPRCDLWPWRLDLEEMEFSGSRGRRRRARKKWKWQLLHTIPKSRRERNRARYHTQPDI